MMDIITYPYWNLSKSVLVIGALDVVVSYSVNLTRAFYYLRYGFGEIWLQYIMYQNCKLQTTSFM